MIQRPSADIVPAPCVSVGLPRCRRPARTGGFWRIGKKRASFEGTRPYDAPNDAPFGASPLPIAADPGQDLTRRREEPRRTWPTIENVAATLIVDAAFKVRTRVEKRLGLLINFNVPLIKDGMSRDINRLEV